MNRESKQIPRLTDKVKIATPIEVIKENSFFNLNTIVLILFLAFFVFFLYNCKSGIFKNIDLDVVPYSMIK